MKVFILSASAAAFWHKIGKGCNVDIIMIEVEKGGGKVRLHILSVYKDIQGLCQAQVQVSDRRLRSKSSSCYSDILGNSR